MTTSTPACRICGATALRPILSLGATPLANALLTSEQRALPEPTYPLDLVFCPACALVQITETVPPEQLFREYLYFSSFSDTALQNARAIAERLIAERHLGSQSLVGEIASNDGYLLQNYVRHGIPVLGIEPALNIAQVAEERGIRTISEFFGVDLATQLRAADQRVDLLHANNVLAHVADLNGVAAGIALLLKDDGLAVIEAPYVKDMLDGVEFDTIYHEHLCYFSLTALEHLFARHGLVVADVERIPIHGGSLRVFVGHAQHQTPAESVAHLRTEEAAWGVDTIDFYQQFGAHVEQLRHELLRCLHALKAEGKRIVAYGASAKGATLLNYFGIGQELLDFVVDRSTVKQGRYTPGTHLLIVPPEHLLEALPDYVLLLTWNFADEILAQQAAYRQRGGQFIIPIPTLRTV